MKRSIVNIQLKRFDASLPIPEYKTPKAAALDLMARTTVKINPAEVVLVPLNVAVKVPDDHFVLISARSSLFKKGLLLANGIGVGDADYCGDNDEYQAALLNFTKEVVLVEKGERLVQMIVLPRPQVTIEEVKQLSSINRGGFGSTGRK